MNEEGVVIALNGNKTIATVEMVRGEYCEKCKACLAVPGTEKIQMRTNNRVNAEVGDRVQITLRAKESLFAMFISYLFPLTFLIAGVVIGTVLHWPDGITGLASLFGVAIAYVVVTRIEKSLKKSEKVFPLIQKVLVEEDFNPFEYLEID